jgi:transcriptional regulator with XRE-family HTH domain
MNMHDRLEPNEDRTPEERNLRVALGVRIRNLRKKRKWSQAEMARRLEVDRTAVLRWEKGAVPSVGMLILLSDLLGTTLDALLAGRNPGQPDALSEDQKKAAALHLNKLASLLHLRPRGPRD